MDENNNIIDVDENELDELELDELELEEEIGKKQNNVVANVVGELASMDVILPLVVYAVLNKDDIIGKKNKKSSKKDKKTQAYLVENMSTIVDRGQNIVGMIDSVNKYMERKQQEATALGMEKASNDKVEILEVVRPYVKGKGRNKIDRAIAANEKIKKLKSREEKDILSNVQDVTDILALVQSDTGDQVNEALRKVRDIMDILRR
ncbi:hypothetical protein [Anaeromicrobium sediminis]|uniref:Uncharacterized protein n=1 Tax=Anaeromicrobium sediminis TaxID=1478221 RepID=A0A267MHH9_9FIRM|nr:hypothetical protein [Anaeromicrobium sediminis]PAB58250.1 hypothetical protein CCE28_16580 [Anaeromicrobium sediminis]